MYLGKVPDILRCTLELLGFRSINPHCKPQALHGELPRQAAVKLRQRTSDATAHPCRLMCNLLMLQAPRTSPPQTFPCPTGIQCQSLPTLTKSTRRWAAASTEACLSVSCQSRSGKRQHLLVRAWQCHSSGGSACNGEEMEP